VPRLVAIDRHELNDGFPEGGVVEGAEFIEQVAELLQLFKIFELLFEFLKEELALGGGKEGGHLKFEVVPSPADKQSMAYQQQKRKRQAKKKNPEGFRR
jgi:hypothetical protein